jgi:DNA-binding response OmpR family regulator
MATDNRRTVPHIDRRRVPRGGRRPTDRPGRHPTLLVAESYAPVRRPFVRYLEHFSFRVTQATNGDELLAAVSRVRPSVILAEVALPRMDARGLSQWLGNSYHTRDIPVIVMADALSEDSATRLGDPAGVLIKPFPLSTLLDEVRRVLRSH